VGVVGGKRGEAMRTESAAPVGCAAAEGARGANSGVKYCATHSGLESALLARCM